MTPSKLWGLFGLTIALASACGGNPSGPATSPTPASSSAASSTPPAAGTAPTTWKEATTKDLQVAYMKAHVVGPMGKTFQTYDAKKYGEFGCKTCHGPNFKEPKAFLPTLTMKDGKFTSLGDKPEITKFMMEKVVPEMAMAMGEAPYNPATHQGFGCANCHKMEMK